MRGHGKNSWPAEKPENDSVFGGSLGDLLSPKAARRSTPARPGADMDSMRCARSAGIHMPFIDCPLKHGLVHEHINAAQRCAARATSASLRYPVLDVSPLSLGLLRGLLRQVQRVDPRAHFVHERCRDVRLQKESRVPRQVSARRAKEQDREYRASQKRAARKARLDALKPPVKVISARLPGLPCRTSGTSPEGSKMPRAEIYKQMKMKGLDPRALDSLT